MWKRVVIYLLVLIIGTASTLSLKADASISGREVMRKVKTRNDGNDSISEMKMTLINKRNQTRTRTVIFYRKEYETKGLTKSLIYFREPSDVKGVGLLSWEYIDSQKKDDKWLYLPSLRRVKRVSSSSKSEYFMGTDFTYEDLGSRSLDADTHVLLREEKINEDMTWVVESVPKKKGYLYSKKISWIHKEALLPMKVEFYHSDNILLKVLKVSSVKKISNIWTITSVEMNNVKDQHKTILESTNNVYNSGLKDNMFTVIALESGIIK